jgi:hypothetical protein
MLIFDAIATRWITDVRPDIVQTCHAAAYIVNTPSTAYLGSLVIAFAITAGLVLVAITNQAVAIAVAGLTLAWVAADTSAAGPYVGTAVPVFVATVRALSTNRYPAVIHALHTIVYVVKHPAATYLIRIVVTFITIPAAVLAGRAAMFHIFTAIFGCVAATPLALITYTYLITTFAAYTPNKLIIGIIYGLAAGH